MSVNEATEKFAHKYACGFPKWLSFIGHTNAEIVVYVSSIKDALKHVPDEFEGFPVVLRKSGKPKPCASE